MAPITSTSGGQTTAAFEARCFFSSLGSTLSRWLATGYAPPAGFMTRLMERAQNNLQFCLARDDFVSGYGFAVPHPRAIRAIADLGPIVEVGAGTGMLAKLLEHEGGTVFATDGAGASGEKNAYGQTIGAWFPVVRMAAGDAVRGMPHRAVLISWPKDWAIEALEVMRPGQHLIFIGEDRHGCTGSERFYEILERDFVVEEKLSSLQLPQMHDQVHILRKSTP